jgi:hypothetical protein
MLRETFSKRLGFVLDQFRRDEVLHTGTSLPVIKDHAVNSNKQKTTEETNVERRYSQREANPENRRRGTFSPSYSQPKCSLGTNCTPGPAMQHEKWKGRPPHPGHLRQRVEGEETLEEMREAGTGGAAANLRGEPLRDQRHPEQQVSNRRILGRQSGDAEGGEQRGDGGAAPEIRGKVGEAPKQRN